MNRQDRNHWKRYIVLMLCFLCLTWTGCNSQSLGRSGSQEEMRCTVTGLYIRGRSGEDLILIEEGYSGMAASYMGNSTGDATIFDDFETGDRIRIVCNNFRETSPMQTDVYECEWLEAGSIEDIPQEHIEHLTLMGQMDEPIIANFDWNYEGKEIHIQATYGALWTYSEVKPHVSEETQTMGLHLYLFYEQGVEVDVLYYPDGFGLCGVGMTVEEMTLDNGETATYYREEHSNGSASGYLYFDENEEIEGGFAAMYHLENKWIDVYEEDIMEILRSVSFSIE